MTRICVEDHDGASVSLGSMVTSRVGNPYFFTGRRLDVLDVSNNGTPHRFTDDVAGLTIYDFRARRMDPVLGRFSQRDPLEYVDGIGLYEYCGGIPVWFVDPLGLEVGEPGTLESFIPVWGSGRQAINDFQTGNYGWAAFNAGMAVSDAFLVKSVGSIALKGAWKTGSMAWRVTRAWAGRHGYARKFQHIHHGVVAREVFEGTAWERIFNQPWNFKPLEPRKGIAMDTWHKMVEGKLPGLTFLERWWYGTPDWLRYAEIFVSSKIANALRGDEANDYE